MEILIIVAIVAAVVVGFILLKKKKVSTPNNPTDPNVIDWSKVKNGDVATTNEVSQSTPKGARVFSKSGVTDTVLSLIDKGLDGAFADAIASGYGDKLTHSEYEIFIPKFGCVASPESQTPSFMLRADSYDGTEYDIHNPKGSGIKDGIGVIYAAEMVKSMGYNGVGQMICCAEESVIENATRYGAEHIIVANNDPVYHNRTWFHDVMGHPILPKKELPMAVGFASKPREVNIIHAVT